MPEIEEGYPTPERLETSRRILEGVGIPVTSDNLWRYLSIRTRPEGEGDFAPLEELLR